MNDLFTRPGYLIRRVHQISTAIFAEECARFDLTPVQYAALSSIGENPQIDATRLSDLTALDRATLGQVLERVEAKGWISRSPSPSDKRIKLLTLSPAGRRLLKRVAPVILRIRERILEPLADREQTQIMRLLAKLANREPHK